MTEDKEIFRRKINELLGDIQKKDERKTVAFLEKTIFEKTGYIAGALTVNGNPGVDRLRDIVRRLEKYKSEMRDYSIFTSQDLKRKINNLISNKNYKRTEVSELMGKYQNYVSAAMGKEARYSLLNIFDFVTMLPEKKASAKEKPLNLFDTLNETKDCLKTVNKNSGTIHVVKLVFEDHEYYLENTRDNQLVFAKSTDRAQWFDETPEAKLEFLTGRKKVVVEFD